MWKLAPRKINVNIIVPEVKTRIKNSRQELEDINRYGQDYEHRLYYHIIHCSYFYCELLLPQSLLLAYCTMI
jgi:hypothetical protein